MDEMVAELKEQIARLGARRGDRFLAVAEEARAEQQRLEAEVGALAEAIADGDEVAFEHALELHRQIERLDVKASAAETVAEPSEG